jgi:hypothetical protein
MGLLTMSELGLGAAPDGRVAAYTLYNDSSKSLRIGHSETPGWVAIGWMGFNADGVSINHGSLQPMPGHEGHKYWEYKREVARTKRVIPFNVWLKKGAGSTAAPLPSPARQRFRPQQTQIRQRPQAMAAARGQLPSRPWGQKRASRARGGPALNRRAFQARQRLMQRSWGRFRR